QFKESKQKEIILENVDENILNLVIEYIYTRRIVFPNSIEILLNLINFTNLALIPELYEIAIRKLISITTTENVLQILQYCIEYSISNIELKEKCWEIIHSSNKQDLIEIMMETQIKQDLEFISIQQKVYQQQKEIQKNGELIENLYNKYIK